MSYFIGNQKIQLGTPTILESMQIVCPSLETIKTIKTSTATALATLALPATTNSLEKYCRWLPGPSGVHRICREPVEGALHGPRTVKLFQLVCRLLGKADGHKVLHRVWGRLLWVIPKVYRR